MLLFNVDTGVTPLTSRQLEEPELLHFDSFINNQWVQASKGARFEVIGKPTASIYISMSDNIA